MKVVPAVAIAALHLGAACRDGAVEPFGRFEFQAFDSTFQFSYPDFNSDLLHPVEAPPPEQQIDQLLYQASVVPTDTGLSSDPLGLWVHVVVRNPTQESIGLPVRGCTVWPEVFAAPQRSGSPLWIPEGECAQAPYSRVIGPSDTAQFSFLAYDVMLAQALPDGRYYWNTQFRRANDTLVLRSGSGDVRLRVPGLRYQIEVEAESQDVLRAQVVMTNLNQDTTRITFGDCALSLSLYLDAQRTEVAGTWKAQDVCLAYLAIADVAPGDSLYPNEFTTSFPLARLSDAGLNAGRYYLSVALSHNWRSYDFPVGAIEIW